MAKKWVIFFIALFILLSAVAIYALTMPLPETEPLPDLSGHWVQVGVTEETPWYFYADITGDLIEIYWYLPEDNESALYWSGTYTPPKAGDREPYTWVSVNDLAKSKTSMRGSREETKTFTYKRGKLAFVLTAGHIQMGFSLEKAQENVENEGSAG